MMNIKLKNYICALCIAIVMVFNNLTSFAGDKFEYVGRMPKESLINDWGVNLAIPDNKNRAILITYRINYVGKHSVHIDIFDGNKKKITESRLIDEIQEPFASATMYNDNELIIATGAIGKKEVRLYTVNLNNLSCKFLSKFDIENSERFSIQNIGDNKIILAGGRRNRHQAYLYSNGNVQKLKDLKYEYYIPQIIKLNDGRVVIVGGNLSAELFNGEKNAFEEVFNGNYPRNTQIAFPYKNDKVAVIMNNPMNTDSDKMLTVFDVNTGKEVLSKYIVADKKIFNQDYAMLKNNKILTFGGATGFMQTSKDAFIYDIEKQKFTKLKSKLKHESYDAVSATLSSGMVLIISEDNNSARTIIQLYEPN